MGQVKDSKNVMVKSIKSIEELSRELRNIANKNIFLSNIKRHGLNWDLIWAAADTIEDSELAIQSYTSTKANSGVGSEYLKIYGLFQAMFMQQDAVMNLAEGLNIEKIDLNSDSRASGVREIRNKYFGHPTDKTIKGTKGKTYHGISRMSVGDDVIDAWTYPNFSSETININESIETNRRFIEMAMKKINLNLIRKSDEFKHSIDSEIEINQQSYAFEKIWSWVYATDSQKANMAEFGIATIKSELTKIKEAIDLRYEDIAGIGDYKRLMEKSAFLIKSIEETIRSNPNGASGEFEAEIYVEALHKNYKELLDYCKEINNEFSVN